MWTCSDWIIKWPKWKNWLASQSWCVWNERPKVSDTDLLGFLSSSLVIHRHIVLTAASWGWHSHWVRVLQWADLIGSREWMYKLDYIRNRCESKTMDLGIWIVFSLFLSTKQQLNLFFKEDCISNKKCLRSSSNNPEASYLIWRCLLHVIHLSVPYFLPALSEQNFLFCYLSARYVYLCLTLTSRLCINISFTRQISQIL